MKIRNYAAYARVKPLLRRVGTYWTCISKKGDREVGGVGMSPADAYAHWRLAFGRGA